MFFSSAGIIKVLFTGAAITGGVLLYTMYPLILRPDLPFTNSQELKDFRGGLCARGSLRKAGRTLLKEKEGSYDDWKKETNKFKDNTGESLGCLGLSWDKQTGNDGYGKGIIKYEWFFSKGHEAIFVDGFYDSTNTEADPTEQKQDSGKNNGKATYLNTKKGEKAQLMWQKNKDIEAHILKRPTLLEQEDKWDFEASKKCTDDKCKGSDPKKEHGYALKQGNKSEDNKGESFDHWHEKFSEIFGYVFDETNKTLEALRTLLKDEKGTGGSL